MIAIVAFTRRGYALGQTLSAALDAKLWFCGKLAGELGANDAGTLRAWTETRFFDSEALVFVGACGIAVRAIAPFVKDKFSDPAVVSIDEAGRFAVPLLSGHVGGANALARRIAALTGGQAAISTATDVNGRFAIDVWAKEQNLVLCDRQAAKAVSAAILEGSPVGFVSKWRVAGSLPEGIGASGADIGICIAESTKDSPFSQTLHLVPCAVTLGVGCRRGTSCAQLEQALSQFLQQHALPLDAITQLASIDLKQDEPGLLAFAAAHGLKTIFYSADELKQEQGEFPPSAFVSKTTGVDNVCQRAAQRAGGEIFIPKTICQGVTFAAAMGRVSLSWQKEEAV